MDYCECGSCTPELAHWSDCAVHNMPASPKGECNCKPVQRSLNYLLLKSVE